MPLRNVITVNVRQSARSVYSKQPASKESTDKGRKRSRPSPARAPIASTSRKVSDKGHGRTRKTLTTSLRVQSRSTTRSNSAKGRRRPINPPTKPVKGKSNLQKKKKTPRKRTSSVTFKNTAEVIESHSSEADLSSEGEETDEKIPILPKKKNLAKDVKQVNRDVEASHAENEPKAEEDAESSGMEAENEVSGLDEFSYDDDELASTDEIDGEKSDSEDVCYSFPEPSNNQSSNLETGNGEQPGTSNPESSPKEDEIKDRISQALFKEEIISDKNDLQIKAENSNKRKISRVKQEEYEEKERSPKKQKLGRASMPMGRNVEDINTPGSSRVPSYSPQHHLNPPRASTSFGPSHSLHITSIGALSKLNKSVSCGNIAADQAFRWMIGPTLPVDFFHNIFEKMPFAIPRQNRQYYKDLFSGNDLNNMLKEHHLEYKVHIDVVKYVQGMRLPVSADGRAYYSNVWEDYKQGFSLRIRNPQTYNKNLWRLCSLLQEYFSSTVGCNIYLTPPKAQGFPPHYDDIDAFIVQVEGKKYWKVYAPRYPEEELARYSSKDFDQNEIGSPILNVCLNAGEMLYIPRGYVHQAATDADCHSLHLTFSTNQLNTWGDLLLIAASRAVEKALLNDVIFRESIPKDYMDYIGSSVATSKAFKRFELINKVKELAKRAMSYIDVDEAADHHSLKFIEASLPPTFNKIEKDHSLHGNGSYWKNGEIKIKGMLDLDTEIQLIRKRNLRLVIGDNVGRLYHTLENIRDPRPVADEESLASFVEFEMEAIPSYLFLYKKYPEFVKVGVIPLEDEEDQISFATSLYENGLIMTKEPLPRETDEQFDWSTIPDILPSFNDFP